MPDDKDPKGRNAYMREYRARKKSSTFERRRPGRKPVDYGLLNTWEFEWYKALHQLRDGVQLRPLPVEVRVGRREAEAQLRWWKNVTPREILGDLRVTSEAGRDKPLAPPDLEYAELERQREIASLEQQLKSKAIQKLATRRTIWNALIAADTTPALQRACEMWKKLRDVQMSGLTCFADHVSVNAAEFLRIKRDRRFPRSRYADESRLEHLARGMAGVMADVSPMTAIGRLGNLNHNEGGPLWDEGSQGCACWRCKLDRWQAYYSYLEKFQLGEGG
jgi:hypothetical protein